MKSYGLPTPRDFAHGCCRTDEQREGLERLMDDARWVDALPLWHEDAHRVYVHAGVPDEQLDLEWQDPQQLLWMRYPGRRQGRGADYGWRGRHVVHGHQPHSAR
jgi:serine/threonine protein phosphatase 1